MTQHVFACLVHEQPDCVVDLLENLRHLDPDSGVIVYDGSADGSLRDALPWERLGAGAHPSPRPMRWGRLHEFAFDALELALDRFACHAVTMVDSEQLLVRR